GNDGHRVAVTSRDELGALARSFNGMAADIESWHAELQQRVDARTAELKAAQDQLLQSRKLAAMAALGAGVAHEINNPLTGVVGFAQLLLARKDALDERTVRSLQAIERESLRIREIVDRMASLAQDSPGDAVRCDAAGLVDAATKQHAQRAVDAKVEVVRAFDDRVPQIVANPAQLQHAIGQLLDNSLRAMPGGGTLRVAVRSIEN